MSLSSIYTELHRRARDSGEDRSMELKGGARLAVRVLDGVTTLTISRKGKRLGDVEIVTFQHQCAIPSDAARYPAEGQSMHGDSWFVAYRWAEGVDQ
jgi:hypothetical protein